MQFTKEALVSNLINQFDKTPTNFSREKKFLSFLVCKNLVDLCQTAIRILRGISRKGYSTEGLPDEVSISMCESSLSFYFSDAMFKDDEEYGMVPNWEVISSFPEDKAEIACKLYRVIAVNLQKGEISEAILKAVENRDKKYFLNNFDKIFKNLPFADGLKMIKNFVSSPYVSESDQEYVWDFFDSLLDIFISEKEHIEKLKSFSN